MKTTPRHQPLGLITTLGLALSAPAAFAADVTWVGNSSNLWNTGSNWSTSAIPANGDTLVFGAPGSAGLSTSDNIASLTVGGAGADGIVFGTAAGSYSLVRSATQTITLGSSSGGIAVKDLSSFAQTITAQLTLSSAQTIQVGGTTGSPLSSLTFANSGLIGGFGLTKTGTGVLTLGNSNALASLVVNQGTLSIAADSGLSSTAPVSPVANWVTLNGGTLRQTGLTQTINANRGIVLGDATTGSGGTISTTNSNATSTTTYNGVIANNGGANSLTKTGNAILALGGTNTYTGETRIDQGQLTLNIGAAGTSIINSSSKLVIGDNPTALGNVAAGNATLFVQGTGTASTASNQTFNGTTVKPGASSIVARAGATTENTTLALGAIDHVTGGTVGFTLLTSGAAGKGVITTTTANTNGILGGWATTAGAAVSSTAAQIQTNWAANDGSGNIVAYTGYTDMTGGVIASNAAANVRATGALSVGAGVTDINTLMFTEGVARTLTIGAGNTLRLGNYGGVWNTSATNTALSFSGGTLTAGGAANTAGEIVFNSGAGAATTNTTITVSSIIANNGSGVVSVVKTGTAAITLSGANSYSGGTYVNQGTVNATATTAFGAGSVTVAAGANVTLSAGAFANDFNIAGSSAFIPNGGTVNGKVTLLSNAVIGSNSNANGGTINGQITGDASLSLLNGTWTLTNSLNDYTGHLSLASNPGDQSNSGLIGDANTVLKLGANEVIANGVGKGNVIIGGNKTTTKTTTFSSLDMNGKSETINGLLTNSNAANGFFQSRVINTASNTTSTLTLGDNNQTATYNGLIRDGDGGAITGTSGKIAITKIGSGVQTFTNQTAYSGGTTVKGGSLQVDFSQLGTSSTTNPSDYINAASALTLAGGSLDVIGRANGTANALATWTGATTSNVITTTSTGLVVGQAVSGTGIAPGTYIMAVGSGTITLSTPPTAGAGSDLAVTAAPAVNTSQSFASTTLGAGASGVSVTANGGNGTVLNLNAITRNNGSTFAVTLPSGTQSATNGVTTTSTSSLNNNVLANAAGGTAFATVGGNDWASLSGNNIVGLSTGAGYTTTASAGTTAANYANGNIDVTSSEGLLSGVITPNTFRFNTTAANAVTFAAGNNVIGAGGILVTSAVGSNLSTITGGNLMGSTIGKDLVVIQNNIGNGLTIASSIVNNGTATTLTKSGSGLLTLSGTNTYTGTTYVNAGTLTLAAGSSTLFAVTDVGSSQFLGTGTVNFNGSFSFDLSGVSITTGSWSLVDVANLSETFGLTSITSTGGLTFTNNAGIWTSNDNAWTFNQSTGILSVSAVPEPATAAALLGSLVLAVTVLRRRRSRQVA